MPSAKTTKLVIALAVLGGLGIASIFVPVGRHALDLVEYVRGAGAFGALLYGFTYVLATVLLVPGSLLTIGAGFLYGFAGTLVVWPASVLGAILAFLLSRFLVRDWVAGKTAGDGRLAAVDHAIGERSFTIIFLLRLSPFVPFTLLNYALGATRARLGAYALASILGMIPGMFLYVYIGISITDAAQLLGGERPDTGLWGQLLLGAGLLATVVATVIISRIARSHLRRHID